MESRNLKLDTIQDIYNLKEIIKTDKHLPEKKSATINTRNRKGINHF